MSHITNIVDRLFNGSESKREELYALLTFSDESDAEYLREKAVQRQKENFGNSVYIRGLIELTSYCKNDCLYCGLRCSNSSAQRYRLSEEQILSCCAVAYPLGFRTFVLQGGEDAYFTDERLCSVVEKIKSGYPDCAVTLSIGERSTESYKKLRAAGADRYLLRHETADKEHYGKLHPPEMDYENRMRCLRDLKALGYQTGCGFMVGSPFQCVDNIIDDLLFIRDFSPQMVGIGPFIPHRDTPFASLYGGTLEMTLRLISIIRLLLPRVLLPATTALGTINPQGRELGILAGANVVMPNISPISVRKKYEIYNNKLYSGAESAEYLNELKARMDEIGYQIVTDIGDFK